jgi:nucleoside-diphosphate-sugar epimerase
MPLDYSRMPGQVDAVIHLAQSKFYREFPTKAEDIFAINIHSTFALLEYARKVGANCFIFASTGGVYGYSYENFAETDPVSPLNFYLSSKYSAELLIANYQQFFRTVVYRFFFVYGPGQKGMLIPSLLDRMQKGETILIEGNPGIRINPIYVADAVRVFEPAFELKYSSLFNVAGDEIVTITDVVSLLEKVVGKQASVEYVDRRVNGDLIGDNRRMKEVLGILPRVSLFEGSHSMIKPEHLSL